MIFRDHQIWNTQMKFSKFNKKLTKNPQGHQEIKIIPSHYIKRRNISIGNYHFITLQSVVNLNLTQTINPWSSSILTYGIYI